MPQPDYTYVAQLVKDRSGIALNNDKHYLFESRLLPLANKHGFSTISEFTNTLQASSNTLLVQELIEAMTTNESMFFRDNRPFDQLAGTVYAELRNNEKTTANIWCAACSSGQEPYSLALQSKELQRNATPMNVAITATDIDNAILAKAKKGVYNQFEAQRGLSADMLERYFTKIDATNWEVIQSVKQLVTFRQHNLMHPMALSNYFDIVFCRYVLIYFDLETKKNVLKYIANTLKPGGYLFLGSAETLPLGSDLFLSHPLERNIYVKQA